MLRPTLRHGRTWLALLACAVWLLVPSLGVTLCFAVPGNIAMGIGTGNGCPAGGEAPARDLPDGGDCDDLEVDGLRDLQIHLDANPEFDTVGTALEPFPLVAWLLDHRAPPMPRALAPPERYARQRASIALLRAYGDRRTIVLSI